MRLSWLAVAAALLQATGAVKHADFKTCAQSGFCKRGRAFADRVADAGPAWIPEYELDADTVALRNGILTATVWKTVAGQPDRVELPLTLTLLLDGVARVQLDEARRKLGAIELRHGSQVRKQRYDEAEKFALVGGANVDVQAGFVLADRQQTKVRYGQQQQQQVLVEHRPFKLTFIRDGQIQAIFNERNFLSVEHWRPQKEKKKEEDKDAAAKEPAENGAGEAPAENEAAEKAAEKEPAEEEDRPAGEDESTWWDETFGGNTDSKPRGGFLFFNLFITIIITTSSLPSPLLPSSSLPPPSLSPPPSLPPSWRLTAGRTRSGRPRHHVPRLRVRLRHPRARVQPVAQGNPRRRRGQL